MSECVVRMEMPSKDKRCEMADEIKGTGIWFCPIKQQYCHQPNNKVIPSWCPIICQLPEGHGRLVDVNIVEKRIKDAEELSEFCDEFEFGGRWTVDLSKIPTIVPAERSKK